MVKLRIFAWNIIFLFIVIGMCADVSYGFPEDAPWMLPARWRLIYLIDTSTLTDENAVSVSIEIPYAYWQGLENYLNLHCNDINDYRFLSHIFAYYASTNNNTQRSTTDAVTVVSTYDVNVCGTKIARFPRNISIYIDSLDGGTLFKDYNHFLFIYLPFYWTFFAPIASTECNVIFQQGGVNINPDTTFGYNVYQYLPDNYSGGRTYCYEQNIPILVDTPSKNAWMFYAVKRANSQYSFRLGIDILTSDGNTIHLCIPLCPANYAGDYTYSLPIDYTYTLQKVNLSAIITQSLGISGSDTLYLTRTCVGFYDPTSGFSDASYTWFYFGYFAAIASDWNSQI